MLKIAVLYEPSDNVTPPERERGGKREKRAPIRGHKRDRRAKLDRDEVLEAVRANGHDAFFHELKDEKSLLEPARVEAALVFNLTQAYAGDDSKEAHAAASLELRALPCP